MIDAHVHVWDLGRRPQPWIDPESMAVIHRDFGVSSLNAALTSAGVEGAILVQVLNDPGEHADYLAVSGEPPFLGLVGWVDLLGQDLRAGLSSAPSSLVGVRHQALAEPDPFAWLTSADAAGAFRLLGELGLAFDLMFLPRHLAAVTEVVGSNAATTFVLDHAGKPPIASGWASFPSEEWASLVSDLARRDNVVCKLSGLTTMASLEAWTVADLTPYVEHLLSCFGPGRILFGSDWPVSLRAGSYPQTVDAVRSLVGGLSPSEQEAILGGTALRTYGLPDSSSRGETS